jgi:glycosyltransferase involved in cell wall biosynthesis
MKVSVIMPSLLLPYKRSAKNRPEKLIRAIDSVTAQTFTDWELIIIADGCEQTIAIFTDYYHAHPEHADRLRCFHVKHKRQWAGYPRNVGIDNAKGDVICYLDSDDTLHPDHLQFIVESFDDNPDADWIWFDDLHPTGNAWKVNHCSINHLGHCGTSNVAHRKRIGVKWPDVANYGTDDWGFVRALKQHHGKYMGTGGYQVCHVPNKFDV